MRELLILSVYLNRKDAVNNPETVEKLRTEFSASFPDDIKDRYHIVSFYFFTEGESRVECVFPKEQTDDLVEIIEKLKKENETIFK